VAIPAAGVYAGRCHLEDGTTVPCVTNVGVNPTFGGSELRVEAHLLDWSGDLYGRTVGVDFRHRIRDEQRFDGVEALVAQIRRDADTARELLG
jgi:riboflavin kinase / FMN adenylyltransferase